MPFPSVKVLSETIRLLSTALPKDLLFGLTESLRDRSDHTAAKAIFADCFTNYDRIAREADATPGARWLATDMSAELAWAKIAHEETYTTTKIEDREKEIAKGIHLFRVLKPIQALTAERAADVLQHWFDYHGTLRNTWRLGVLVAIREIQTQTGNTHFLPPANELARLENEALRGLRAIRTLEQVALAGGVSQQHVTTQDVRNAFEERAHALKSCLIDIEKGFYPAQRRDNTSDERTLAYRFILLYLTIGLEPLDARITPLLDIGGRAQPSADRFRRMQEKLILKKKGTDPILEIKRLFASART